MINIAIFFLIFGVFIVCIGFLSESIPLMAWGIIFLLFSLSIFIIIKKDSKKEEKIVTEFYDGEGNKIPNSIVNLEVKSHFCKMKKSEMDSINKYFYLDTCNTYIKP